MTTKKIEKLTQEQIAKFSEYISTWTKIGLCTDPADRPSAEQAIRESYSAAGLAPPERIIWCGSPLSQGVTRAIVLDPKMGASVGDSVYGQHDANWLAFYAYFREICGLETQTEKLQGLTKLAKSAGWAIPHQKICWVSERHQLLARNERGRLHSISGPAVLYPDGWAIYAVNGTRVPSEWVEKRAELDPRTALSWQNIEQRRAAAELLGWSRVLEVLQPRVINKNRNPQIGTLLSVDLPDAPDSRFLKVKCGTGRDFVLPVPQTVATALEANAWTYNLKPNEYKLEART